MPGCLNRESPCLLRSSDNLSRLSTSSDIAGFDSVLNYGSALSALLCGTVGNAPPNVAFPGQRYLQICRIRYSFLGRLAPAAIAIWSMLEYLELLLRTNSERRPRIFSGLRHSRRFLYFSFG